MSFEVTVTPTVYNVEVEVNPSVQPFDVQVITGNVPDLNLTTNGDSGASTFDPLTGELNIPEYTLDGLGGVPESRTITINGVEQDLSADRTFTIPSATPVTIGSPANGLAIDVNQVLTIGLASSSTNGALSSTDWSTFNGKQDVLTNPVTGTGATGQVSFWTGIGTQSGDNGLFWDNTNKRLGVGTNVPLFRQHIIGTTSTTQPISLFIENGVTYQPTTFDVSNLTNRSIIVQGSNAAYFIGRAVNTSSEFAMGVSGASGTPIFIGAMTANDLQLRCNNTTRLNIFNSTGNVLIQNGGTFTDAGFRLDVNGTARVQGVITGSSTEARVDLVGTSNSLFTGYTLIAGSALKWDVGSIRNSGFGTAPLLIRYNNANLSVIHTSGAMLLGGTTEIASSIFTIESTTRGFLPPRMTSAQRDAIASPVAGLIVYNTTDNLLSFYNGTAWTNL